MSEAGTCFVLADSEKCIGCRACETACFAAHEKKNTRTAGAVTSPLIPNLFLVRTETLSMPVQCHHCEDAPCLRSCLTGALFRRDGAVLVNRSRCIGCRNCALACPFGAISIAPQNLLSLAAGAGPVFKCDLCANTGRDSQACVETCPGKALRVVDAAAELEEKRRLAAESMGALALSTAGAAAGPAVQGVQGEGGK
ncbi:MAG: 4Fe-4S dicluster domain-containing protein [Treponema sp.]|jgi:electron transport protein HydN|nr:4Fe-4S dicluster domain-containing protein [Treponema sp.]